MHSPQQKRILLAEDDSAISEVVSIILRNAKYAVTIPTSYDRIRSIIHHQLFDLVLLDVLLWGRESSFFCKEIKSNPRTKHTPVILLSARADVRNIADAYGADDTLEKPFEVDQLIELIKKHLK